MRLHILRGHSFDLATHVLDDFINPHIEAQALMRGGCMLAVASQPEIVPERTVTQVLVTPECAEALAAWLARVCGGTYVPRPRMTKVDDRHDFSHVIVDGMCEESGLPASECRSVSCWRVSEP